MTILSYYKRKCDKCGKTMDKDSSVSIVRGKIHYCIKCAGKELNKYQKEED